MSVCRNIGPLVLFVLQSTMKVNVKRVKHDFFYSADLLKITNGSKCLLSREG